MKAFRALRLAAVDLWEEAGLVVLTGIVGGLLSLLLVPLPLVLAGYYGTAYRLSEDRGVSWRTWLADARAHAGFFYRWVALLLGVAAMLASGLIFYGQVGTWWGEALRWFTASALVCWLAPQPLVPALYFQQADRPLRVALRNAAVLALSDSLSMLVLWAALLLLVIVLGYLAWALWILLPVLLALASTRLVALWVRASGTRGPGDEGIRG